MRSNEPMKWVQYQVRISGIILAFLTAGLLACSGGGGDPEITPTPTTLSGTVVIAGNQLADLLDPSNIGAQDEDKWAVRVIDPTESVDAIVLEHTDTLITPVEMVPLDEYLVEIELLAAVDLSGGEASVTPVVLDCEIPIAAEAANTFTASIELIAPTATSGARAATQAGGYTVRISYALQGPQPASALLEIDWSGQRLRRDTNGNGRLDDETYFADTDRNGVSDNRQQGIQGDQGHGPKVESSGQVTAVDQNLGQITVQGRTYLIDETTAIIGVNGSTITLQTITTGLRATVEGHRAKHGEFHATRIQLLAN